MKSHTVGSRLKLFAVYSLCHVLEFVLREMVATSHIHTLFLDIHKIKLYMHIGESPTYIQHRCQIFGGSNLCGQFKVDVHKSMNIHY